MRLEFRDHDKLVPSKVNMRYAKKAPDVADILPSVRRRGIIVPLIVRDIADDPGTSEIVAGLRRWTADGLARAEGIDHGPLPCAILDAGDDADAIEASLIENVARRDPDEVTQWETFTKLVKEGRSTEEIGETFGFTDLTVRRILALGNLLPRIRDLYRAEKLDRATVRHLTMASKSQQKAWLALLDDRQAYAPTGHQLKAWLFGGSTLPARHALFDLDGYGGALVADLFGEDRYFADAGAFWTAQNAAIEARRAALLEAGWSDVVIVGPDTHFSVWEYEKAPKRKGGRVYVDVRASGEVTFHEGYLTRKEARRAAEAGRGGGEPEAKPQRPELTSTLQTYVDLHRHAAVRAGLLAHPQVALRLMVAHAIVGSHLWRVTPEQQLTKADDVRESVETSRAEVVFDERRRAVLALLGFDPEAPTVCGGNGDDYGVAGVFARLIDLPDTVVLEVVAVVIGETLASGSAAVDAVGGEIGIDMADWWQADDALFENLRDKEVLRAIVAELAGETVAAANADEKAKTLRKIARDHLDGSDGRPKAERWVPRWMRFPPAAYTTRGGVATLAAHARAAAARERPDDAGEPEPMAEAA